MGFTPNRQRTVLKIFFGTNLLVCVLANSENLMPAAIKTESLAKPESQADVDLSCNKSPDIEPLPPSIFTIEVSDFLSPDIFSQTNPFVYFLKKTQKLSDETIRQVQNKVWPGPPNAKYPQRYIPYAKFVMSLLGCFLQLKDIKQSTRNIRRFLESKYASMPPDIFTLDPVISPLFSSYVFSDYNPPARLLCKLLEIPENDISSLPSRVQELLNHRHFPRLYSRFTKCLLIFLKIDFLLRRLKNNIVEIQHVVPSSTRQSEQDPNNLQIDDEVDLKVNPDDVDSSAQPIAEPDNSDENTSLSKSFKREVRTFLSPDLFSQPDPYAYFLVKTMKLSKDTLRLTNHYLTFSLDHDEFPQRYIPYAELASSLLSCLIPLGKVENIIGEIQRSEPYDFSHSQRMTISKSNPELSKLFADKIFVKSNPLPRVLSTLLDTSDNEILEMETRLLNFTKSSFRSRYRRYGICMLEFLQQGYLLLRLKDNIAEFQRSVVCNSSPSDQLNPIFV